MIDSSYFELKQAKWQTKINIWPESHIKTLQAREFYPCFVVKFLNSTASKDCFSQLKEAAQFPYMIWREWLKFYAWILIVKFSSNKAEVALCLHFSRKILKCDRNCHLYVI